MTGERELAQMFEQRLGASQAESAEVFHQRVRQLDITCFEEEITGCTRAEREGFAVRTLRDRRMGSFFSERVAPDAVDSALSSALGQCGFFPPDEGAVIYPGTGELFDSSRYRRDMAETPLEQKQDFTRKLERAARALDKKIITVPQAKYAEYHRTVTVVTTSGLKKSEAASFCGAVLQVTAKKGRQTHTFTVNAASESFFALSPLRLAQEAVLGVLEKMNPKPVESGSYPAVLSQEAASKLLGAFFLSPHSHLYAENALKGQSRFAPGKQAASREVTIYDNPRGNTPFARMFDDEGVPSAKQMFIREGTVTGLAYSVSAACREKTAPTGHSLRGGYRGAVSTGLHAPCLANGEAEPEELLDSCREGVYITELDGLHAGLDPVTGSFSLSARGFVVHRGRQGKPLGQCTVAGNLFELLSGITARGCDRRDDTFRRFSAPSLLISRLSVSS